MEDESSGNKTHQSTKWELDVVTSSTPKKRKRENSPIMDSKEIEIIEKFEDGLQKSLTEKAAKNNLSQVAVKIILRYVVSDENVLALLIRKENEQNVPAILPFEPKITRSKAKELSHSGSSLLAAQWDISNTSDSKVKRLLTDDLHEDSSDDEYVPVEEESEDDSVYCSVSNPPTPARDEGLLDEEVFKTPQSVGIKHDKPDDENSLKSDNNANIALRTRSKLSLSQTPLEQIEQSFVPPDITSDMYELECNDDNWKNFLNSFAQPLEEVVKNAEEEEHDPEYNILADEEITKVDTEELRDDRGVKVPKRELNDLMAELFEYVDIYEKRKDFEQDNLEISIDPTSFPIKEVELDRYIEIFDGASNKTVSLNLEQDNAAASEDTPLPSESLQNLFSTTQLQLFKQQMSQHVQMLVQNFLLTFRHPCFSEYSIEMKEYLLNFKCLSEGNEISMYNTINLKSALELIEKWEKLFEEQNEEALGTIENFKKVMEESIECFENKKHFYLPFPDSILRTISESDIFIYPQLLPQIPFKHPDLQNCEYAPFSLSEYQLIALGLEQFVEFLINDKEFITSKKEMSMTKIAEVIHKLLVPARKKTQIYRKISENKNSTDSQNPITFYFKNRRAPFTVHRVIDLDKFGIVPPKERPANVLPRQWRFHIHEKLKDDKSEKHTETDIVANVETSMANPPVVTNQPQLKPIVHRPILPAGFIPPTPKPAQKPTLDRETYINKYNHIKISKKKFKTCFYRTIPYLKYVYLKESSQFLIKYFPQMSIVNMDKHKEDYMTSLGMLPNMPCLDFLSLLQEEDEVVSEVREEMEKPSPLSELNKEQIKGNVSKDSVEDVNVLMVASSNVKSVRRDQSLVEKKKAKKRKEYLASIAMLAPSDPATEKKKREDFSTAYMKKLEKTLGKKEFHKLLELFTNDKVGDAVDLYKKLRAILSPQHQDLVDEFLLFLTAEQACAVGQLIPFFIMNHKVKFLRNLELFFKDQPAQLRKVYKCLQDLSDTPDVNLERIKGAILPLLKSNPLLCDSFLQIFLEESPTATLLNGAWDVIDVNKELIRAKEEGAFENLEITDEDSACTCSCHKTEGDLSLKHHCNNCGLKFIQGKVYCQTSKGMKPVDISFPFDPDVDHKARLAAPNKIRRIDPNKEIQDDGRTYIENDIDGRKRKVRVCKSTNKTTPKPKTFVKKDKAKGSPKKREEKLTLSKSPKKKSAVLKVTNSSNLEKEEKSTPISEADWKNLPSPENINIPLFDSDSSQENESTIINSIKRETIVEEELIIKEETFEMEEISDSWTREEDRILLETFKQNIDNDAIGLLKQQLTNRSEEEIRMRFDNLMALFQEMYARGDMKISMS